MRSLPVNLAATFAIGLRDDSRIKMSLRGQTLTFEQAVMAQMLDAINITAWLQTDDARKGRNRPQSLYRALMEPAQERDFEVFDSIEEFEAALAKSKE